MKKQITGVMVYYYKVCPRKLWYFYHEIQMEQNNENVQIGRILDQETFASVYKGIHIKTTKNGLPTY